MLEHDVFSLDGLIAWLEKQPAEETYDYMDCFGDSGGCLLFRYLNANGIETGNVGGDIGYVDADDQRQHPSGWDDLDLVSAGEAVDEWTYGAALARAKALRG
jgi:hypothetical protein